MEKDILLRLSIYRINSFTPRKCFAKSNTFRLKEFLRKLKKKQIFPHCVKMKYIFQLFNVCNSLSYLSKDMSKIPKRIQSYKKKKLCVSVLFFCIYDW